MITQQSSYVELFHVVSYSNVWKDGKLISLTLATDTSSCCRVSSSDSKLGSEESISRGFEGEVSFSMDAEL